MTAILSFVVGLVVGIYADKIPGFASLVAKIRGTVSASTDTTPPPAA